MRKMYFGVDASVVISGTFDGITTKLMMQIGITSNLMCFHDFCYNLHKINMHKKDSVLNKRVNSDV